MLKAQRRPGKTLGAVLTALLLVLAGSFVRAGEEDARVKEIPRAAIPTFSHPGGFVEGAVELTIRCETEGAEIRYTLDASDPGPDSEAYGEPLNVTRAVCVRARVFAPGLAPSHIASITFLMGERPTLPVLCIVTDPRNLHDPHTGLLAHFGARGQEWERPCFAAFFEPDGTRGFALDAGIRAAGGVCRHPGFRKKSFRLYFRKEYGGEPLRYPLFGPDGLKEFRCIRVRASGNDQFQGSPRWTLLRDALNNALFKEAGGCATDWRFAVVAVNADVLGVYDLREHCNGSHMRTRYGIKDPDLLKVSVYLGGPEHIQVKDGDKKDWLALEEHIRSRDMSDPAQFAFVEKRIDLDNLIDEHVFRLYGSDWDWPQNNRYFFRDRKNPDSRWRFVIWDSEWTFSLGDNCGPGVPLLQSYLGSAQGLRGRHTFFFKRLLENPGFRLRFLERLLLHVNTVLRPENVIAHIDALAATVGSSIHMETRRWGVSAEQWMANVEVLRRFARERPAHFLRHVAQAFQEARGPWTLTIGKPDTAGGSVRVNGIEVPLGAGAWTGSFLRGLPVTIEAAPSPGFRFAGWTQEDLPAGPKIVLDPEASERLILHPGSGWKYSDHARDLETRWREPLYPPEWFWLEGAAPLGYGDPGLGREISPGKNPLEKTPTCYFRHTFKLEEIDPRGVAGGAVMADDGAVVYVNGKEVFRTGMPEGAVGFGTWATETAGGEQETAWRPFRLPEGALVKGWNVVAVEVHQAAPASSDLRFDLLLRYEPRPVLATPVFERE